MKTIIWIAVGTIVFLFIVGAIIGFCSSYSSDKKSNHSTNTAKPKRKAKTDEEFLNEIATEMADMILKELDIYNEKLPAIYDKLSRIDLLRVRELLLVIENNWHEDKFFGDGFPETEKLKRILNYPKWNLGSGTFPSHPSEDLSYVENLINQ